jgi:CubicO group peptidase (beta-lactamase class C family)
MVPAFQLQEIVREARSRTKVPGLAAGLFVDGEVTAVADGVLELGRDEPVRPDTPFRIASISKPFTASLALSCLQLDGELAGRLSHTAGLRCESQDPFPGAAEGLFSYSNAGYWAAGEACARGCGVPFAQAMRERVLDPLGLAATGYEEPSAPARGHVQEGETGHRAVPRDVYPAGRRASGGLWSTVGDLLAFAAHHLGGPGPLGEEARAAMRLPRSQALGAGYGLGWWVREDGGRLTLDHEGSVAGYQSLLLLVPEQRLALAVLTNSWRGSGLVRHVVEALGLAAAPAPRTAGSGAGRRDVAGRYALDAAEATVEESSRDGLRVREAEVDPVTGDRIERPRFPAEPFAGGVYAFAGGVLMSHRLDFPLPDSARIGWVVLPRAEP